MDARRNSSYAAPAWDEIIEEIMTDKTETTAALPKTDTVRTTQSRLGQIIFQSGPLIALLLIVTYLSFATPHFLTVSNLVNVVRQSSITAILAIGQTLVILTAGIDISVGAITALAGSVAAVLMTSQINILGMTIGPVNVWVGILVAVIVGILAGWLNGIITTKGRIPDFIATLGTLAIFRGVALLITGGLPVPSHLTATAVSGQIPPFLIWLGSGDVYGIPAAGIVAVLVTVAGYLLLRYTSLGRFIYAVGGNREAARVSGINVDRVRIAVYMFSGLACAIAAMVLVGRLNSANALDGGGRRTTLYWRYGHRRHRAFGRRRRCIRLADRRHDHGGAGEWPQPAERERLLAAHPAGFGGHPGGAV